jgi:cyclophilin family peptidyl-prolyl cis-trans isomerase
MKFAAHFLFGLCLSGAGFAAEPAEGGKGLNSAQLLESAKSTDWRRPDPANTLYMELPGGRVVIELAPRFAPLHVANIRQLVNDKYFDGLAVLRVQDNYVTQWGDPTESRVNDNAKRKLPDETVVPFGAGVPFVKLPDSDGYAPEVGWIDGFAAGVQRNPSGQTWLTHCYGVVGVGRGDWPDTGSGAELYVVIGQAPRHLDRNIVTVGRVLRGMELLSSMPRGTGALGFYEKPKTGAPIKSIRLASEVPESERSFIEVLRTDTPLFTRYVESRRNRREAWFVKPLGHIDVCNINIPVREAPVSVPNKQPPAAPQRPLRRSPWQCEFDRRVSPACL